MKYDDWDYHAHALDEGQAEEDAATHIGLFLKWCSVRGLASDRLRDEVPDEVEALLAGAMPAAVFLLECWDGKLVDDMLTDEGNAFARSYYDKGYLEDFLDFVDFTRAGTSTYPPEAAVDEAALFAHLDARWKGQAAPPRSPVGEAPTPPTREPATPRPRPKKPWWRFWD